MNLKKKMILNTQKRQQKIAAQKRHRSSSNKNDKNSLQINVSRLVKYIVTFKYQNFVYISHSERKISNKKVENYSKITKNMEKITNDNTKAALYIGERVKQARNCLCRLPASCNYGKKTGTKPIVCYCACSYIQGINSNTMLNMSSNNNTTTSGSDSGYKTKS